MTLQTIFRSSSLAAKRSQNFVFRPGAILLAGVICLSGVLPAPVQAGVFSVLPVRIYMNPRDRAVAVTITNEGDEEVVLQADLNDWKQKADGTEEQTPTEDLILSPPIIKLAPKARQVVRLARVGASDATRQLTYRMILREVPEAVSNRDKNVQMSIALALSMPVFITPPTAKRVMTCGATRMDGRTLDISCANTGTAYAQVREVVLRSGDQQLARFEGGTYILPGARKSINIRGDREIAAGTFQLSVGFDDGQSQTFNVTLP